MFPTMLLNPWVILGVIATLATSCTTGYVAGRKHEVNKWKAEQAEHLQAQIREREAYLANIAEMVKRYNEKKEKTRVIYREISNQVGTRLLVASVLASLLSACGTTHLLAKTFCPAPPEELMTRPAEVVPLTPKSSATQSSTLSNTNSAATN